MSHSISYEKIAEDVLDLISSKITFNGVTHREPDDYYYPEVPDGQAADMIRKFVEEHFFSDRDSSLDVESDSSDPNKLYASEVEKEYERIMRGDSVARYFYQAASRRGLDQAKCLKAALVAVVNVNSELRRAIREQ